jgi:hypothetical protein
MKVSARELADPFGLHQPTGLEASPLSSEVDRRDRRRSGRRWWDLSVDQQLTFVDGITAWNEITSEPGPPLALLIETCTSLAPNCDFALTMMGEERAMTCEVASADPAKLLTERQIEDGAGPVVDALNGRSHILECDLEVAGEAWPRFTPLALAIGYSVVHVISLRAGEEAIGALTIYCREEADGGQPRLDLLKKLAGVSAAGVANQREHLRIELLSRQLQHALDSRIVIEQAKGMLAARLVVDPETAFSLLRRYARNNGKRIHDAAREVLEGNITALDLRIVRRRSA